MVRHAAGPQGGQFAAHAIGMASNTAGMAATGLNPLTAVPQLAMSTGQLYQGQMTLYAVKALSASVATLQATTAVIGVGVAVTGALVAVNLWQTLKLRKDIKQMRLEVEEGFLNLHEALADQGEELLKHIDQVAEDVEFRNHRTILVRAYGKFKKALNRLRTALTLKDFSRRNDEITAARDMLFDALADYDNNQLMEDIPPAAYLRRRECVWAIEQAVAMTFQMQGEFSAVSDRLISLDQTIRRDAVKVVSDIKDVDELDFFFPEIHRIHDHDLATIAAWQAHADWYQTLDAKEAQQLAALAVEEQTTSEAVVAEPEMELIKPPEYVYYKKAQEQSPPGALRDSLLYLMDADKRIESQNYIAERAPLEGLSALTRETMQKANPLTIANLEYYFLVRDEAPVEKEESGEANL
jgi:DNA-binding ferritin-like protein